MIFGGVRTTKSCSISCKYLYPEKSLSSISNGTNKSLIRKVNKEVDAIKSSKDHKHTSLKLYLNLNMDNKCIFVE